MPPAFWIVLILSLILVLTSSSSSRTANFAIAVVAPLVVTLFVWLLNMFFADDYALGSRAIGGAIRIFLPSLLACLVAAFVATLWKRRSSQE